MAVPPDFNPTVTCLYTPAGQCVAAGEIKPPGERPQTNRLDADDLERRDVPIRQAMRDMDPGLRKSAYVFLRSLYNRQEMPF